MSTTTASEPMDDDDVDEDHLDNRQGTWDDDNATTEKMTATSIKATTATSANQPRGPTAGF